MFYPEYVDMETDALGDAMNQEMIQFLEVQLQALIIATVEHLRKHSGWMRGFCWTWRSLCNRGCNL